MYLTRIILNHKNRYVHRDLGDCYRLHKTILSMFSNHKSFNESVRTKYKILYRIEINPDNRIVLFIHSSIKPDWTSLEKNYLSYNDEGTQPLAIALEVDTIYSKLKNGMHLKFLLSANPTKKIRKKIPDTKTENKSQKINKNGQRIPLLNENDQIEWINRKGIQHGFSIVNLRVFNSVPNLFSLNQPILKGYKKRTLKNQDIKKNTPKTKNNIINNNLTTKKYTLTFNSVLFKGVLTITNSNKFLNTLKNGIGSGKAFGFGLLSISPIY